MLKQIVNYWIIKMTYQWYDEDSFYNGLESLNNSIIKVGDIVRLNSDFQRYRWMTVLDVTNNRVTCVYFSSVTSKFEYLIAQSQCLIKKSA